MFRKNWPFHNFLDYLLNCGSNNEVEEGKLKYIPDDSYISTGNKTTLSRRDILPMLQTLRFFPDANAKKYCYNFLVLKGSKYLVKTIYYHGGFDGRDEPPIFDQIIDGTRWSIVNTTEDYTSGETSFYEAVVMAHNKFLSVCLARNEHTASDSSPFISSIEVHYLDNSVYNSTNLHNNMLITIARSSFGSEDHIIRYGYFSVWPNALETIFSTTYEIWTSTQLSRWQLQSILAEIQECKSKSHEPF